MTKASKILVVFVTVASLAFMGFALISTVGGPNWEAEISELDQFVFERSAADPPIWSAKVRGTDESVGASSPVLAEVVVAAWKKQNQMTNQVLQGNESAATMEKRLGLNRRAENLEQKLQAARQLMEADIEGMKRREANMVTARDTIERQSLAARSAADEKARQLQVVRLEGEDRREDVLRLENELRALRTDQAAVEEQRLRLDDQLVQLEGALERLEERHAQLEGRLAGDEPEPTVETY